MPSKTLTLVARMRMLLACALRTRELRTETVALIASVFLVLACNGKFWSTLLRGSDFGTSATWWLVASMGLFLIGLYWFLLLLIVNRWTAKPVLLMLLLTTSAAVYFTNRYNVYLDRAMLRNLLETDVKEAVDMLDWRMLVYAACYAVVPGWLLWRTRLRQVPSRRAMGTRITALCLAAALALGSLWAGANEILPTVRAHREVRHFATPLNYLVALANTVLAQTDVAASIRVPIAVDAHRTTAPNRRKPIALVLVVGETVRAANWGLSGYMRQTTPALTARRVVNFADVTSCGTDTATSVPCMFSVYGRRHYDERRIRTTDSLLHIIHRASVSVLWRDNQGSCKHVCDGLPFENLSTSKKPEFCGGGRCFDAILLDGLREKLAAAHGDVVIVLHMLGNHGPAYYERYPPRYRKWQPTCDTTDLASCTHEAVLNTYDNAVRYTDDVLAQTIDILAHDRAHDTAFLYVSDHGESLGEHNLYLHGIPYAIAPKEQTHIPMVMWISGSFAANRGLDEGCVRRRAVQPGSHDHLFHTTLRLLGIATSVYDPTFDVTAACWKDSHELARITDVTQRERHGYD